MFQTLNKVIKDCFTERDGQSWCLVRIGSIPVVITMLYKFIVFNGSPDFISLAGGIAAIWAAIAFKNNGEK